MNKQQIEEKYYRFISILRQTTEEEELKCSINMAHQQTADFGEDVRPILERYFRRKTKLRLRLEKELKRLNQPYVAPQPRKAVPGRAAEAAKPAPARKPESRGGKSKSRRGRS
jgi:hypothetical protein